MTPKHFPYRFDKRWAALFLLLGVSDKDGVTITSKRELIATFGRFNVKTTLDNIDHTAVTGPHRWYTAVGLRLSFADDGITFGTNHRKGLSIAFVDKIPKVIGFRKHSTLWVSVADPEGLAAAIGKNASKTAPRNSSGQAKSSQRKKAKPLGFVEIRNVQLL
jgi:hypothetical protein